MKMTWLVDGTTTRAKEGAGWALSVRQLFGADVPVVRLWMLGEPHRADGRATLEERPRNPVHAVHHAPVGPQIDRVRQVDLAMRRACSTTLRTVGALGS
jgi:hypothetical protein